MMLKYYTFAVLMLLISINLHSNNIYWSSINSPVDISNPATDLFADSYGRLYVSAMGYDLFYTDDYCQTWNKFKFPEYGINFYQFEIDESDKITANGYNKTYTSTDRGETWEIMSLPENHVFLFEHSNGDKFCSSNFQMQKMLASKDNGSSWEKVEFDFSQIDSTNIGAIIESHDGTIYLAIGEFQGEKTIGGIIKSTDVGKTWSKTELYDQLMITLAIANDGSILANRRGLYGVGTMMYSENGQSWIETDLNDVVFSVLPLDNGKIFAVGSNVGVYISNNNGMSWDECSNGFGDRRTGLPVVLNPRNGKLYNINVWGELYETNDTVITPKEPLTNMEELRFLHLAADIGEVDVYINGEMAMTQEYGEASSLFKFEANDKFELIITESGKDKSDYLKKDSLIAGASDDIHIIIFTPPNVIDELMDINHSYINYPKPAEGKAEIYFWINTSTYSRIDFEMQHSDSESFGFEGSAFLDHGFPTLTKIDEGLSLFDINDSNGGSSLFKGEVIFESTIYYLAIAGFSDPESFNVFLFDFFDENEQSPMKKYESISGLDYSQPAFIQETKPRAFTNVIEFNISPDIINNYRFELYNLQGKPVESQEFGNYKLTSNSIDISHLTAGCYQLVLINGSTGEKQTHFFLKLPN